MFLFSSNVDDDDKASFLWLTAISAAEVIGNNDLLCES